MLRLDPDLWRTLSPLFDQALDLDRPRRDAFLSDLERSHPNLATELARLLREHDQLVGAGFLEAPLNLDETPAAFLVEQAIGPYTLEAPIGIGGMGTVWRARRSDGRFDARVAVKLLNLALLDRQGDERFKREGTLLARLAHPHIARLLDAGVTSTGQPYLVLEYVDGMRIDRFADERRLDPLERLRLFLQVIDAVAHAHANLIVHRDLKPSNILVNANGEAKLLDFGIAKLLQESTAPDRTLTLPASRVLTPEFAAPEQVRGEPVTTATDVYALGVLLFWLLTGRHPTGSGCRTPSEHLQALLERDAVRASRAALEPTDDEATLSAALRRTTPARLRRLLRGDLDNVLAKALDKHAERRYQSVDAFAEDIRRFLKHEPLSVRRQPWRYRASKFVRRHRGAVAAAAVAFAMLATGLFVADRQRRVAESRFRQLRQLSQQVFEFDSRIRHLAGATEARQALVAASLEYLERLSSEAGGDLDLMQEVSDGYWRVARIQGVPIGLTLGDFAKAEDSLRKAEALIDSVLASRPRDRRSLERAAIIAHDRMILADSERRDAEALGHARRAVERQEAALGVGGTPESQPDPALSIYANVSAAYVNLHRYEDAAWLARRLLQIAGTGAPSVQPRSYALSVLANALRYQGDLDGALAAIRQAREIGEGASYPNESKRMFDRYPLLLREAFVLGEDRAISLNRPNEALPLLRDAFEMHEAGARRDPNDFTSRTRVGTTGRELGDILRWREPAEAIRVYDEALVRLGEIRNNVKARRDRALVLANSWYALRRLNRTSDARRRVDEALAILTSLKDAPSERVPLDSELFSVLQAIADQHVHEGNTSQAIADYERLLQTVRAGKPEVDQDLRQVYALSLLFADVANVYRQAGAADRAEAVEAERRALWGRWNNANPNNTFVRRQVSAIQALEPAGDAHVTDAARAR